MTAKIFGTGWPRQRKFDELKGELHIKPVKVGFAAFYEELGRVGLVEECAPKGISKFRSAAANCGRSSAPGQLPDARVMRPETASILIEQMKNG